MTISIEKYVQRKYFPKKSFLLNKHCKITTLPTWVNKSHVSVRCSTIFYSHATFDIHWKTLNWVLLSIFSVYTQIKLCFFYYHNVFLFSRRIFFFLINLLLLLWIFYFAWHFILNHFFNPLSAIFYSSSSHSISSGYGYMITK